MLKSPVTMLGFSITKNDGTRKKFNHKCSDFCNGFSCKDYKIVKM